MLDKSARGQSFRPVRVSLPDKRVVRYVAAARAALRSGDAALPVWPGRARPGCSPGGEPGCSRSKAGRILAAGR